MATHNTKCATFLAAAALWASLAAPGLCATPSAASRGLLYVALTSGGAANAIAVFPRSNSRKQIGLITQGLDNVYGLITDAAGNLYAGNSNNTITVYPPGQTAPSLTYTEGLSGPSFMAIGPDGSLYVSNGFSNTVEQFPPGSTTPSRTISFSQAQSGIAVDSQGDLFVITGSFSGNADIQRFKPGSVTGESLGLHFSLPAETLAIDKDHNYIVDFPQNEILVLARDAPHAQINQFLVSNSVIGTFAFSAKDQALYVEDWGNSRVVQMAYPYHNYANVIDGVTSSGQIAVTAGGVP